MSAYYNEIDPFAARWLRNLIAAGHITPGDVDERSIADVQPDDLKGYTQCHFFAGIGGWSYALRLAGWPDDEPVWTGSCPCQPLSSAGQRKGHVDERHLWPAFYRLIAECAPAIVFGEQVASKLGREWLSGVRSDLEALGFAVGAADLCAAGVGAPHIRQRLWWGAQRGGVAYTDGGGSSAGRGDAGEVCGLQEAQRKPELGPALPWGSGCTLIPCADGKARRVGPGVFPLAHGVSARVGRLRGYGNAIVPQVAAEFIAAYLEAA
jgi:DNA (cytosine-5)-methyltransferase 1